MSGFARISGNGMNWSDYRSKLPPQMVLLIEADFPRLQETGVIAMTRTERLDSPRMVSAGPRSGLQRMDRLRTTDVQIQAPLEEPGYIGSATYRMTSCKGFPAEVYRVNGVDFHIDSFAAARTADFVFQPAEKVGPNVEESADSYMEQPEKLTAMEARFAGILFEDNE